MIMSATPSLLTSPALLTAKPERSPALMPFIAKPLEPSRLDRSNIESNINSYFVINYLDRFVLSIVAKLINKESSLD